MAKIVFEGKVFSGKGEGRKFVALPWVKHQIQEKLGFTPFLGTLNLRLNAASMAKRNLLAKAEAVEVRPEKGYCKGALIKAKIGSLDCAIVLPKVPKYPDDILEVVAAVCLREHFKLSDGNTVAVAFTV